MLRPCAACCRGATTASSSRTRCLALTTRVGDEFSSNPPHAKHAPAEAASKRYKTDAFRHDPETNRCICPADKALYSSGSEMVIKGNGKGHYAVRAYQISGGSHSNESEGWKLFHVNQMTGLTILPSTFSEARRGYKRADKAFRSILAQL